MGYSDRSKAWRFSCLSLNTKIVESTNTKFFENGDLSGNTEVREEVFEEDRQTVTVTVVLNRTCAY